MTKKLDPTGNGIVFKPGEIIASYSGERVSQAELNRRYHYDNFQPTAPYGLKLKRSLSDGACKRGVASMVNDFHIRGHPGLQSNAALYDTGNLLASKNIRNGTEILVSYGPSYRRQSECPPGSGTPCLLHKTGRARRKSRS